MRLRRSAGFTKSAFGSLLLLFLSLATLSGCSSTPDEVVPDPVGDAYLIRGRTMVRGLAACGVCHGVAANPGSPLSGGREFLDGYGSVIAPNITSHPDGIGRRTTQQLFALMRTGTTEGERTLSPLFHAGYEWLSDDDLLSIIAYLRSVPAVPGAHPVRELGTLERNTFGLFDEDKIVRGYVSSISPRYEREYGEYLVNHVARCSGCHSSLPTMLSAEVYLGGGQEIVRGGLAKIAPNVSSSPVFGIGSWSEEAIVNYLRTGNAPDGSRSDSAYCPTNFYALAPREDLQAIARYLRTVK